MAERFARPGPWYSMMVFLAPATPWRRSSSSTASLAETQSGKLPSRRMPQISGMLR